MLFRSNALNAILNPVAAPTPAPTQTPALTPTPAPTAQPVAVVKPAAIVETGPTEAQKAFIRKYVDKLTYLVYYNDKTPDADLVPLKSAVSMANSWLTSQSFDVANSSQIEKLKKDRQMVYEEQSGEQSAVIQWISQSLNADVYLDISARMGRETRGGNYYSQATVTIQMYETSTGQLLGSTPAMPGPQRMSSVDQVDADSKTLQDTVYNLMPKVIEQSKTLLAKQCSNGIKYQVIIQKATDPDVIAEFRSSLKRQSNVADVVTRSESEKEVIMDVFMFGRIDDLGDAVRTLKTNITGLEKMRQIQKRGKTVTYDSGM